MAHGLRQLKQGEEFPRASLSKFIREADKKLAGYIKRLDDGDAAEERVGGNSGGSGRGDGKLAEKITAIKGKRERRQALLYELGRNGEDQISLPDPDARAMARMTKVGVGYNTQLAVDTKHKLIAVQEVCNQVLDLGLLAARVKRICCFVSRSEVMYFPTIFRYDALAVTLEIVLSIADNRQVLGSASIDARLIANILCMMMNDALPIVYLAGDPDHCTMIADVIRAQTHNIHQTTAATR
ncbi:hypothetical protein [Acidocella aminolytica]|uniref:Transposase n=1 Tax=Acidocella aminolytica 101 = DSM 11237 TaxID=1120923 RepID=A0A0D6PFB5_9PROT|nr:hypothetical protein [Acidocella aminolytica]GAN79549.1 hypothetical protein Aam_022_036 [Acidocella aminolytica 101 = DSM 11237]GBQ32708.1 hypothetical protein AA11237_0229 [Acidocella aminolytica 101 = DSM 11237]SHF33910.1 hypothetical protein SAMN02746095_02891 [Acidocella aminolytica 101 = DSM 11237]